MYELFFGDNAAWFAIPAFVGTIFFFIRCMLMLTGAAADIDADIGESGEAFQLLSLQTLAAFAMGFGWGGLGGLRGFGWDESASLVLALLFGAGMVWMLGLLLKGMNDLQSSGNIALTDTVGKEGDVYATIPGGGRGQIRLVVNQSLQTYNAMAAVGAGNEAGEDLPTGTRVRVIAANPDNTLTVVRA
jgi:hypothetical protein